MKTTDDDRCRCAVVKGTQRLLWLIRNCMERITDDE